MAKDPAFLFYTGDFSTGTQFFTDEQVGKYLRLMMAQHQHGHLTEQQVNFICKSYDFDVIAKFKKDDDGKYFNQRLEIEINRRKSYTESRGLNKSGKTKLKTKKSKNHMKMIRKSYDNHMENENENENINEIENRKFIFSDHIKTNFISKYSDQLLGEFISYWTEHNPSGLKMRFEMEKVFDYSKRLARWQRNQKPQLTTTNGTPKSKEQIRSDKFKQAEAEIIKRHGNSKLTDSPDQDIKSLGA